MARLPVSATGYTYRYRRVRYSRGYYYYRPSPRRRHASQDFKISRGQGRRPLPPPKGPWPMGRTAARVYSGCRRVRHRRAPSPAIRRGHVCVPADHRSSTSGEMSLARMVDMVTLSTDALARSAGRPTTWGGAHARFRVRVTVASCSEGRPGPPGHWHKQLHVARSTGYIMLLAGLLLKLRIDQTVLFVLPPPPRPPLTLLLLPHSKASASYTIHLGGV